MLAADATDRLHAVQVQNQRPRGQVARENGCALGGALSLRFVA